MQLFVEKKSWIRPEMSGKRPENRIKHSCCVINNYMYVFGGVERVSDELCNSVYRMNLETYHWSLCVATVSLLDISTIGHHLLTMYFLVM